jgi:histidine phosphotransferase ChpT
VGPISAIGNGVEILEEEDDPAMQKQAVELLAHSAELAANRLKFMRLAFGAAGGEGVAISLTEARQTASDFLLDGRGELNWPVAEWTCPVKVPDTYLIYAATFSNASGLLPPSVECLRRGL